MSVSILLKIFFGIILLLIIVSIICVIFITLYANKYIINVQKESFEDSNDVLNQLDKKLNILESKMMSMKDPIENEKKKYNKQVVSVTSNHYYTPTEMSKLQKFSL
jgi:CMP-2-keto-3-deoxyoctulosonic acid synthetase